MTCPASPSPGQPNDKLLARTQKIGQDWQPRACPTEFFALGGQGLGVPLRATMSSFGPVLLAKVLGLNEVQESSLGLVFHYADQAGLPLLDLKDLRAVLTHLTSDEGKAELKAIGGLSAATVGVILRTLITFADQGAEEFFGEPEFDTADLLRVTRDGQGVVSLLELPNLVDRPAVFSTFLMWLLADLFHELPEVGDVDKPKLVFFFDEAHLLFADASKAFLDAIAQTVRLIRSKGVGIFFVTQTPKDVPDDVLAQLGSRVQHQLRAHTPNDAKALKQTVATFPKSHYDLAEALQQLGIGEAIVTVMDPDGAPTPVAWTRMRAPQSLMAPTPEEVLRPGIAASALMAKYGQDIDRDSAHEMLARKLQAGAEEAERERQAQEARGRRRSSGPRRRPSSARSASGRAAAGPAYADVRSARGEVGAGAGHRLQRVPRVRAYGRAGRSSAASSAPPAAAADCCPEHRELAQAHPTQVARVVLARSVGIRRRGSRDGTPPGAPARTEAMPPELAAEPRGHRARSHDRGDGRPRTAGDSGLDAYALSLSLCRSGGGHDRVPFGGDPAPGHLAGLAVLEHGEITPLVSEGSEGHKLIRRPEMGRAVTWRQR